MPTRSWLPALILAAASAPAAAESGHVERLAIVDRAIELHGGELYRQGTVELDLCSKSGCFHLWVSADGDAWEHRVSGSAGGRRVEVRATHDAVELWRDGEPVPVEGEEQRWRDFAMARVYFPFLPYRLNDPGVWKQDLGLVSWEGRQLHRVKVTFESGSSTDADDEYMYWLDPGTGRVELFAYSYQGENAGMRFRRGVDHRRVGGILFFDQENFGVEGEGLAVEMIDPAFVAERMRHVSTVRLQNIRVSAAARVLR